MFNYLLFPEYNVWNREHQCLKQSSYQQFRKELREQGESRWSHKKFSEVEIWGPWISFVSWCQWEIWKTEENWTGDIRVSSSCTWWALYNIKLSAWRGTWCEPFIKCSFLRAVQASLWTWHISVACRKPTPKLTSLLILLAVDPRQFVLHYLKKQYH